MEIITCQSNIIPKGFAISKYSSCAFGNEHTLYLRPTKMTMTRMPSLAAPCRLMALQRTSPRQPTPEGSKGFGQGPPRQLLLRSQGLWSYPPCWATTKIHPPAQDEFCPHPSTRILLSQACTDLLEGVLGGQRRVPTSEDSPTFSLQPCPSD